jgi:molybdopterin biosynthesis enzyme
MGIGYVDHDEKRTPIMFLPGVMEACAVSMLTFAGVALRKLGRYPEPHVYKGKAVLTRGVRKFPHTLALTKLFIEGDKATPVNIVGDPSRRGEYAYLIAPENSGSYEEGEEVEPAYLE